MYSVYESATPFMQAVENIRTKWARWKSQALDRRIKRILFEMELGKRFFSNPTQIRSNFEVDILFTGLVSQGGILLRAAKEPCRANWAIGRSVGSQPVSSWRRSDND